MALMFAVLSVGLTDSTGKIPSVATQEIAQEVPQVPAEATPIVTEETTREPTEEPEWTTFEATEEAETWRTFTATAYIALCDTGCSGYTATEYDVRNTVEYEGRRVIAVDPAVISLGTAVEVRTADGSIIEAIAWDTGGAIKGRKIDVLMADIDDAWDFGRQAVQIRILKETVINDGN